LLHLPLMAEVDRIFLVDFNQQSLLVEYLLPKSNCILLLVDQFQVPGCSIHFAFDIETVRPFSILEGSPVDPSYLPNGYLSFDVSGLWYIPGGENHQ
jgi:hypothetical protein